MSAEAGTLDDRTEIEKLGDPTIEHRWLHSYDVTRERYDKWLPGDWHCVCGWFGNHGWEGFAAHLSEVLRLRAVPA